MTISTTDWLAGFTFAAVLLLPLWLPHAPMFVQVPIAILITLGCLFSAVSALRNRWRLSKSTGQFLGYYLSVSAVAIAIIIACLLLVIGIGRLFST